MRLKPRPGGDLLDIALAGRVAVIEDIEQDDRGATHVVVVLESDPGRDLAVTRHPAHRFFFAPDELELLAASTQVCAPKRVLVAGIGNVFLGDDGFGAAVAQRLAEFDLPPGVEVVDFGIRGLDLAYALGQPYDAAILVDTMACGGNPGRLQVIEPETDGPSATFFDGHRMGPAAVLRLARRLGGLPAQVLLVGCEPMEAAESEFLSMSLSAPVAAAREKAVHIVLDLVDLLLAGRQPHGDAERERREKGALP